MADQHRGSKCRHGDAIVKVSSTRKRPYRLRVTNHDPTCSPIHAPGSTHFHTTQIIEPRVLRFRSSRPLILKTGTSRFNSDSVAIEKSTYHRCEACHVVGFMVPIAYLEEQCMLQEGPLWMTTSHFVPQRILRLHRVEDLQSKPSSSLLIRPRPPGRTPVPRSRP